MGQANPSTKGKPFEKVDCPPNKPKEVMGSIVGETPAISKLPPKAWSREGERPDEGS